MSESGDPAQLALITTGGPTQRVFDLAPPGPYLIGRRPVHEISLTGDDRVSRDHAQVALQVDDAGGHHWFVTDTESKHGTWLNGVRLAPNRPTPIRPGDMLQIVPWTFRVVDRDDQGPTSTHVGTRDDAENAGASVAAVRSEDGAGLAQQRLELLLDVATTISAARDEAAMADALLDAALSGTGYANAALLKPRDDEAEFDLVAHRGEILADQDDPRLSRSLLRKAAEGTPARLSGEGAVNVAMSIMELKIEEALCVPIMLGGAVAAFLYLDNRGGTRMASPRGLDATSTEEARSFAIGLGRLAGLALRNLKQSELEQRYARVEAELAAGAEAQRWILPDDRGVFGALSYMGESRPGRFVGGDFFDIIPIDESRLAVALGDVAGKGIPASVLMTASEGYLHAALQRHVDPGRAVTALNRFVCPRKPESRFLTLWVGVFDLEAGALDYVDAGHGYAVKIAADHTTESLCPERGGGLVGIDAESVYVSSRIAFPPGARLLVLSDGFVEQPGAPAGRDVSNRLGMEGVLDRIEEVAAAPSPIAALFELIEQHAGTSELADDATALFVVRK